MPIISLIITVLATSAQGAFKKHLNTKCERAELCVSTMITFFALIFFVVFTGNISFSVNILPYSVAFALCYACATATYVFALGCGSLALTQLVLSYSCVIPLIYSLACGDDLGAFRAIGIVFLFTSLIVTYYRKEKDKKDDRVSPKWVILVALMFLSNGGCNVVQRMQQIDFGGVYDNSFMLISLVFATVLLLVLALIRESDKMLPAIKCGALLSMGSGVSNGLANYFGLICLSLIPGSIYFPVRSAAGLVLTALISLVIFKEKLRVAQYVGVGLGVIAMIFINIP